MYSINLNILINWCIPPFLRKAFLKALLSSLLISIQNTYNNLRDYRDLKNYELAITPQVIWLEKMLNDKYDAVWARIYIEEYMLDERMYIFNKSEIEHPPYIYNKSENQPKNYISNSGESNIDIFFKVRVPQTIFNLLLANNSSLLNEMKANINKYKVYGTYYSILPFIYIPNT